MWEKNKAIGESKWHNHILKMSILCAKDNIPLILRPHKYLFLFAMNKMGSEGLGVANATFHESFIIYI